jgi:hypothetical protein
MTMERSGEPSRRLRLARDGWQWMKMNFVTEALRRSVRPGKSFRLRYEDFVGNPPDALRGVLNMLGESSVDLPPFEDGSIELTGNHTVGGNSVRFRTGRVKIELDTRWLAELDRADRFLSGLVALPLLHRYGYRLDGSAHHSSAEPRTSGRTQEVDQGGHR